MLCCTFPQRNIYNTHTHRMNMTYFLYISTLFVGSGISEFNRKSGLKLLCVGIFFCTFFFLQYKYWHKNISLLLDFLSGPKHHEPKIYDDENCTHHAHVISKGIFSSAFSVNIMNIIQYKYVRLRNFHTNTLLRVWM